MLNIISPYYYWPHMTQNITQFVTDCDICQKINNLSKIVLLQAMLTTDQPFECFSIDTVNRFNYYDSTKVYQHLMLNHTTRYLGLFH